MTKKVRSLADKAILVKLSISRYAARIQDKEAKEFVSQKNKADARAFVVSKRLLDPDDKIVSRVTTAVNNVKNYHRIKTVPWDYDGTGVIRSTQYPTYAAKMRELMDEYHEAVKEYIKAFIDLKERAKPFLGDSYNENDYPSEGELEYKFKISLDVLPIPQAGDFRVDLPAEAMAEIEEKIKKAEKEKLNEIVNILFKRLYDPVKHMVEILSKDDSRIFGSLIGNIEKITEILPDLNLTEDPELENLRKEIEEKLLQIPIEEIRGSDYVRKEAKELAKELANKIKDSSEIEDDDELLKMLDKENNVVNKVGKPVYGQTKIKE